MGRIAEDASSQNFAQIPELQITDQKGIESRSIVEKLELLSAALNEQANQLDEWREQVIKRLLRPLVDEEEDAEVTGEEYEDSAKLQDELMVYVQVLRAAVADRQDALSGETNELIKHESEVAEQQAMAGIGPAPQKLLELFKLREQIKPDHAHSSLRSAIADLRALATKLQHEVKSADSKRAATELWIADKHLKSTQQQLSAQNKATALLEQEMERFTNAMNTRLDFYRQLQTVSDSVAMYEGPKDKQALAALVAGEEKTLQRYSAAEAKHRYRKLHSLL